MNYEDLVDPIVEVIKEISNTDIDEEKVKTRVRECVFAIEDWVNERISAS